MKSYPIRIVDGRSCVSAVIGLITEYTRALGRDLSFQHLDAELENVTKKYGPPHGEMIVARVDGCPIGMVDYQLHAL